MRTCKECMSKKTFSTPTGLKGPKMGLKRSTYFSSKVFTSSHIINGKFSFSLYVGRRTVYLSLPIFLSNLIKCAKFVLAGRFYVAICRKKYFVVNSLENEVTTIWTHKNGCLISVFTFPERV